MGRVDSFRFTLPISAVFIMSVAYHSSTVMVDEDRLLRSICRDSFFDFVKEMWPTIISEEPVWNWHIEYLCNEIQQVLERALAGRVKEYDLLINIPPGTTKSTLVSVMAPVWVWTRRPDFRTIVATHTYQPLGLDLSRRSRDIIQSPLFRRLFPDIELREDQNTKEYFLNTDGGYRLVATVGGKSPTGMHGHLLIVDDPLNPQEARSMSMTEINATNHWLKETFPSRKVDKAVTPTIMCMQRLHQNDPSGMWIDTFGEDAIRWICLPATSYEGFDIRPAHLSRYYVDGLLDPVRLPESVLTEVRKLGQFLYAGQYGESPVPIGGGMFIVERFVEGEAPGRIIRLVRYWDKAATADGGKFTAGVLMGEDDKNRFWILDVCRGQWSSDVREDMILQVAKMDRATLRPNPRIWVEQEPGSGGKDSALATIRNLRGFPVYAQPVGQRDGNKVLRADPLSAAVNGGNVYLYEDSRMPGYIKTGPWKAKLIDEFRYFPYGTYKDQVDAAAGAYNQLTKKRVVLGALK